MEYIDNRDLREWVKKSLRKTLFQKAHELAVQTGCEILLRVQDVSVPESLGTQYYGTQSVQKMYDNNKLQKRPGEILVCGESGLPVKRKVDRGIQMTDGTSETSAPSEDERNENNDLMQDPFVQDSGISTDVDMPNLGNTEYTGTNGDQFENHQQKDDKIDLTQDSDSDDSIVEVGEVKEEPGAPRQLFKQEQAFADRPVCTHIQRLISALSARKLSLM
ncbi:uncharacterized protein [Amphiura filiformis]|uniref:uncharacterized protein isoform X2 n=1 Tax=Amphiura filiformis TaxID=82378 RepID=UPI003B216969